jgi:hypothetical protein
MSEQRRSAFAPLRRWYPRLSIGVALALTILIPAAHANATSRVLETRSCVRGSHGLIWHVVQRHATYNSITAAEPRAAQIYRGTIRSLPHSQLSLVSLRTWGLARERIGGFHPYAIVYWSRGRPRWLILMNSPTLGPAVALTVPCQR